MDGVNPYKIERRNSDLVEAPGVLKFLKIAHGVRVKFWSFRETTHLRIKHSIANGGKDIR